MTSETANISENIQPQSSEKKKVKFHETWTFIIIVCVLLPLTLRCFLYSPRHIPSSSMKPTLLIGDYIFISKFEYGYSRYTFPLGNIFNYFSGRTGGKAPERGDIIVFRPPNMPDTDYIKRLIGLPGDKVQMINGRLFLNGSPVPTKADGEFLDTSPDNHAEGSSKVIKKYIETLPNGVTYNVLDDNPNGDFDNTPVYIVPQKHYFFMGDNRDNSSDSRASVGFVPEENIVGKAKIVFFSNESKFLQIWKWVVSFRTERFVKDVYEEPTGN
jgi:signal peptidase I